MKTIVQKDNPVLRKKALAVPDKDIKSPKIKKIIKDMMDALDREEDGVAIAAPQIGESLRIFVVSGKIIDYLKTSDEETATDNKESPDMVFINPKIKKLSKTKKLVEEGCLSVRYLYGKIERAQKAKVEAQDENGNKFEMGASGLLAQIFQHETDHLDGVLFIDSAKDLRDLPPEKIK